MGTLWSLLVTLSSVVAGHKRRPLQGCSGAPIYTGSPVDDMVAFVRRDRARASVIWWSFCNEAGCGNGASEPAVDFRLATYAADGRQVVVEKNRDLVCCSILLPTSHAA